MSRIRYSHGEARRENATAEYRAWVEMRQRCYNSHRRGYKNYGGRGIQVCAEWRHSFSAFLNDVGRRPSADHSLDRINVDGHYEPGNVRWATWLEQCRNRRVATLVGRRFGAFTVIAFDHRQRRPGATSLYWRCRCDCGTERIVFSGSLTSGASRSCGCSHRDLPRDPVTGRYRSHAERTS